MAGVRVDRSEVDKLRKDFKLFNSDLKKFNSMLTTKTSSKIIKMLKNETPKDSGDTANEWKLSSKNSSGFEITNGHGGIITFLMKGVKPHRIEPKNKSVLTAKINGSMLFAKFVDHPGYKPQMNQKEIFDKILGIIEKESSRIIVKDLKKRFS